MVRYHTKKAKTYSLWRYSKNGCAVKYFRRKRDAIDWTIDFNVKYFNALYDAYLHSPENGDPAEWRRYWRERLISKSDFMVLDRPSVLKLQKFVVHDPLWEKMCI
jgi:hypothetical protein